MKSILLSGFMAAGKTTWGLELARRFELKFFDVDREIERKAENPIAKIFARRGEDAFRLLESSIFAEILKKNPDDSVFAAGGGFVINPNNLNLLKNCTNIFIDADFEQIFSRLSAEKGKRPLVVGLGKMDIKALFDSRRKKYCELADYMVEDFNELMLITNKLLQMEKNNDTG